MKKKNILIILLISFIITNILVSLDYETVSLFETYRDFEAILGILFFTTVIFIVFSIVFLLIIKIKKLINGRYKSK